MMFSKIYKTLLTAGNILEKHWVRPQRTLLAADGTPIKPADIEVNEYLTLDLQDKFSVPVVSEEHVIDWEARKDYRDFWLLDPLNGRKEFTARFGDFSICLTLIRKTKPLFGIIYAPALDLMYYAAQATGSFCFSKGKKRKIELKNYTKRIGLVSRYANDQKIEEFFNINKIESYLAVGGALKFCYLAEGQGTVYVRYSGAKEWDVGAGDLILREAGGTLISLDEKKQLSYNNEDLLSPPFLAVSRGLDITSFK
jgi:3'(2'), 5'-bisphosphate nucleotidase